jgi:PAS domain S-box-containing protein
LAFARDITERESLLSEMQQSQKLLRTVIDATPDWIYIKDRDHRYQLVNQGFAEAMNLDPEEFIGKNDLELGFPEEIVKGNPEKGIRGFWQHDLDAIDGGKPIFIDSEPVMVDDQLTYQSTTKVPLRDDTGKVSGVLGFSHDITERVQLMTDMQQSQEMLETVINATPDWIFIKDRDHRYQLTNRAYAESMKISPEEFIGKNDLELGFPEDIVKGNPDKGIRGFWPDDLEVMESDQTKIIDVEPAEVDGQPVYLSTIKVPLRDSEGKVWAVLGYVRDITDREQLLTQMEQRVHREQTIREITEKMRAATSLEQLIKTATEELGERLAAGHALVELGLESDQTKQGSAGNGHSS